eukprot:scaffold281_cov87-Isochrysis_galbana.AAC.1
MSGAPSCPLGNASGRAGAAAARSGPASEGVRRFRLRAVDRDPGGRRWGKEYREGLGGKGRIGVESREAGHGFPCEGTNLDHAGQGGEGDVGLVLPEGAVDELKIGGGRRLNTCLAHRRQDRLCFLR